MTKDPSSEDSELLTEELRVALKTLRLDTKAKRLEILRESGLDEERLARLLGPEENLGDKTLELKLKVSQQKQTISDLKAELKRSRKSKNKHREEGGTGQGEWREVFAAESNRTEENLGAFKSTVRALHLQQIKDQSISAAVMPAFDLLRSGDLAYASRLFEVLSEAFSPRIPRIFSDLLTFFQQDLVRTTAPQENTEIIIHFAVWGNAYVERFLNYCLPTLLAPGNLPWISRNHKIKLLLHTDEESSGRILENASIESARRLCDVDVRVYPGNIGRLRQEAIEEETKVGRNFSYFFLGAFQSLALAEAKRTRAHVMLLVPDSLFENQLLEKVWKHFESGYLAVTSQSPTTDSAAVIHAADDARQDDGVISVSADTLVELQIAHLHPDFVNRTIVPGNPHFSPRPQQLFPVDGGFVIRAFHYHPIALAAASLDDLEIRDLKILPADQYILSAIVEGGPVTPAQVFLPSASRDIGLIGMGESDGQRFSVPDSDAEMTTEKMVGAYLRMLERNPLSPFEVYCLENRVVMRSVEANEHWSDGPDLEFFTPVLQNIRTKQPAI